MDARLKPTPEKIVRKIIAYDKIHSRLIKEKILRARRKLKHDEGMDENEFFDPSRLRDQKIHQTHQTIRLYILLFSVTLGILYCDVSTIYAQNIQHSNTTWWRLIPFEPTSSNKIPQKILNERGKYFDGTGWPNFPLDHPPKGIGYGIYNDTFCFKHELGIEHINKSAILIIGKFQKYSIYFTPSHHGIYTDIHILVKKVIIAHKNNNIMPGQTIPWLIIGGTLSTKNGQTISYLIDPTPTITHYTYPAHTYMIALNYMPAGKFYQGYAIWDLTSGRAMPANECQALDVRRGISKYAGLNENELIHQIRQYFRKK